MLILDYKLRLTKPQQAAIDEAIRTTQFVRNKALQLWMDGHSVGQNNLQALCAELARDYPFAARREFHGSSSGSRPGVGSHQSLLQKLPGTQAGQERLSALSRQDTRSVEYKTSGWTLEPDGKRLTFTDGHGIGTVRLMGKKGKIETFPLAETQTRASGATR